MEPWEIMICESQERMLAIVDRRAAGRRARGLRALGPRLHRHRRGHRHARCCASTGTASASPTSRRAAWPTSRPVIRTPSVQAGLPGRRAASPCDDAALPARRPTLGAALLELLAAPNIASKRWAYEQYDYIVQANTVQIPGSDAAVLRIKGTRARHRLRQRLQRPPLLPRPVSRRQGRRRRGGAQPELRRRAAGGRHRLPQLRQPREGRDLLDRSSRPSRAWPRPARPSTRRSSRAT